jgi:ribosomal protein S13
LADPPEYWESAPILMLLLAMNRVGRRKALTWLRIEEISPQRRIGDLTKRQRYLLGRHLDTWQTRRDDLRRQVERASR